MNLKLLISLLEAIYLSYTFHFLKTGIDFNIFASPSGDMFKHLISNDVGLRICVFGQIMIIPLILLLILRNFTHIDHKYIQYALGIAFIISLINLNATAYLIPVIVLETINAFCE